MTSLLTTTLDKLSAAAVKSGSVVQSGCQNLLHWTTIHSRVEKEAVDEAMTLPACCQQ